MKPLTSEWVEKAEADFISAQREFRARKQPNYDATCFFSQQWIEKYIKARLQDPGESASKEEAAEVLKICRDFRQVARLSLGLAS